MVIADTLESTSAVLAVMVGGDVAVRMLPMVLDADVALPTMLTVAERAPDATLLVSATSTMIIVLDASTTLSVWRAGENVTIGFVTSAPNPEPEISMRFPEPDAATLKFPVETVGVL
jgi:hypothetical protein